LKRFGLSLYIIATSRQAMGGGCGRGPCVSLKTGQVTLKMKKKKLNRWRPAEKPYHFPILPGKGKKQHTHSGASVT